jgi:hypothetical protein
MRGSVGQYQVLPLPRTLPRGEPGRRRDLERRERRHHDNVRVHPMRQAHAEMRLHPVVPVPPTPHACAPNAARWLGGGASRRGEVLPLPFLRYRRVKIQGRGR